MTPFYFLHCITHSKQAYAEPKITGLYSPFFAPTPLNPSPCMRLIKRSIRFEQILSCHLDSILSQTEQKVFWMCNWFESQIRLRQ